MALRRVLISGGTGLVGQLLSKKLLEHGFIVSVLTRSEKKNTDIKYFTWSYRDKEIEKGALKDVDYVVHLAGAGIADGKWTPERKQEIVESRVRSCEFLYNSFCDSGIKPKAFISASGIGYYGAVTTEKTFVETDEPCDDFLGEVCDLWERAADSFQELGSRVVKLRTGVVLSSNGGALNKMSMPFKMGVGSEIGNGKQYMPWIHIEDLCNMFVQALENEKMEGTYNAVADEHVTNKDFSMTLAYVLKRPFWFPKVPAKVLQIMLGEMAVMLLEGSKVSNEKIESSGFSFKYPKLEPALRDTLIKKKGV